MDKIDQKILLELDKDPRASFNQLGKAARVSKEVAQYRFKQLIKNNILTGFFAFVNPAKLGYQIHKILVKYKSVTKEIQKDIIDFIRASNQVAWAGNSEGVWDLIITTLSPGSKEFTQFYLAFFSRFGDYFKEKDVLIPISNPLFNDKYLAKGKLIYKKEIDFNSEKEKIDSIDRRIILELSLNSRLTFTEIGKKVSLSYWAVAQRYKQLVNKEIIIALKPRIDFRKMGYEYYHLLIELSDEKIRDKITAYYTEQKDCIMIMSHIGSYSMHIEFVLKKDKMQDVILDFRERFGNSIIGYESLLILEEYVMNLLR